MRNAILARDSTSGAKVMAKIAAANASARAAAVPLDQQVRLAPLAPLAPQVCAVFRAMEQRARPE